MKLIINTDGGNASVSKPGTDVTTASAFVARIDDVIVACGSTTGVGTTNTAEYGGLLLALKHLGLLLDLEEYAGVDDVEFVLDSEVVKKQMTGEYKPREPRLGVLHEKVVGILDQVYPFISFSFRWVRREFNKEADKLCDLALEGRVKDDIFQSLEAFVGGRRNAKDKAPSLGQLWKAGKRTGTVTAKVRVVPNGTKSQWLPLCDICGAPWSDCGCPPLGEKPSEGSTLAV
jgi:ribonuclease HI